VNSAIGEAHCTADQRDNSKVGDDNDDPAQGNGVLASVEERSHL
jgi:hypothetical protein